MNATRNTDRFVALLVVLIVPAVLVGAWLRNYQPEGGGGHGHGEMAGSATTNGDDHGVMPTGGGRAAMPAGDDHGTTPAGSARPDAAAPQAAPGTVSPSGSAAGSAAPRPPKRPVKPHGASGHAH